MRAQERREAERQEKPSEGERFGQELTEEEEKGEEGTAKD